MQRRLLRRVAGNNPTGRTFRVLSYNVLADKAIGPTYGEYLAADQRYMPQRWPRIVDELSSLKADVCCFQEVEDTVYLKKMIPTSFRQLGLSAVIAYRSDGLNLVTAYSKRKFDLVSSYQVDLASCVEANRIFDYTAAMDEADISDVVHYINRGTILQLTVLRLKWPASGNVGVDEKTRLVVIGNIHVFWGRCRFNGLQVMQIGCALRELQSLVSLTTSLYPDAVVSSILLGDFNSEPHHPMHNLLETGNWPVCCLDDATLMQCVDGDEPIIFSDGRTASFLDVIDWRNSIRFPMAMVSSYKAVTGKSPLVSSSWLREDGIIESQTLDYIYFKATTDSATGSSTPFNCSAVLESPTVADVEKHTSLPSPIFPSDHIAQLAEFCFSE